MPTNDIKPTFNDLDAKLAAATANVTKKTNTVREAEAMLKIAELESDLTAADAKRNKEIAAARIPWNEAKTKYEQAEKDFQSARKSFSPGEIEALQAELGKQVKALATAKQELVDAEEALKTAEKVKRDAEAKVQELTAKQATAETALQSANEVKSSKPTPADLQAEQDAKNALKKAKADMDQAAAKFVFDESKSDQEYAETEAGIRGDQQKIAQTLKPKTP